MIDTIVLILEMNKFKIKEPEKFSPPADFTKDRIKLCKNARFKYIRNPTKQELEKGFYYPRMTLMGPLQI